MTESEYFSNALSLVNRAMNPHAEGVEEHSPEAVLDIEDSLRIDRLEDRIKFLEGRIKNLYDLIKDQCEINLSIVDNLNKVQ